MPSVKFQAKELRKNGATPRPEGPIGLGEGEDIKSL
jgi:hypothetical protein